MTIRSFPWAKLLVRKIEKGPSLVPRRHTAYAAAVAIPLFCAAVATPLLVFLDLANIVMLFLLGVVSVAVFFGRGPAILATVLSVAVFDFGFVPPRLSFKVSDVQYLVTFSVMLGVGLLVTQLTSRLRSEAQLAARREAQSTALYEFARDLSGALQTEQILEIARNVINQTFRVQSVIVVPDSKGRLNPQAPDDHQASNSPHLNVMDIEVAQWCFDNEKPAGVLHNFMPSSTFAFYPLISPMRARGVLALFCQQSERIHMAEQSNQIMAFAALVAIALERQHYIDVAQDAIVHMESERLRNSVLSALSHDIRTPLTSLVGLSESLAISKPPLAPHQLEMANALHEGAMKMHELTSTLLEMARIQSGKVNLNLQWQYLEEVVGSALRACRTTLASHEIRVNLPSDLPLVRFDAVLIERVLCNLLENAAKYAPIRARITIAAKTSNGMLEVEVRDSGPGLPVGQEQDIFEKFVRGQRESALPGVGLGLSMCRAIVEAHQGLINGYNASGGGACIVFTLPLGKPPDMPSLDDEHEPEHRGTND
ncbi:DUF4118 domain-containing protein [Noviherbaspirillum denitrificans]|uniref:histidine kinase n=1 Tax=Noviherbaspirillum denitrificans TaxID=1968433 RepID=A0A254T7P2_9BURK|nr:DUF4118 domain-containing protein [Noviherbaspirillum denitrificans]OWW18187.1 hypothetical protein AYR66_01850 [Noviherbaspirillum denitrificans]